MARRPVVLGGAASLPIALALLVVSAEAAPLLDQQQTTIDGSVGALAIGGASEQKLAQVVTAGVSGTLVEVRLPITCTSNADLILSIEDATSGAPDGTTKSAKTFAGVGLPAFFPAAPSFRSFPLQTPVALAAGDRFAIVLGSTVNTSSGNCAIFQGPVGDPYAGGDSYFDARPSPPGWTCACTLGGVRHDLPFQTIMETGGTPTLPFIDVAVTKTASAGPVAPSQEFSYELVVKNAGTAVASGVSVTDDLPSALTFLNVTGPCTYAPQQHRVTCTFPPLAVGATDTVTILVRAPPAPTTLAITNIALVQAQGDAKPQNNVAQAVTTVVRPDLSIVKMDSPDPVATNAALAYTLQVTNHGPTRATAVTIVDTLPAGVTFTAAGGCAHAPDLSGLTGGTVTCGLGTLSAGGTALRTIIVTAPSSARTLSNTATVSAAEGDSDPTDDTSTITTTVLVPPTVFVTKTSVPSQVAVAGAITYRITVQNSGGATGAGFTVTDTLPPTVKVTTLPTNASCTHAPGGGGLGGTVTCAIASDPGPAGTTLEIGVTAPSVAGQITNSATATANFGGSAATASATTDVIAPVVVPSATGCSQTVAPGDQYYCAVSVLYPIGAPLALVTVSIAIPPGGALISASGGSTPCISFARAVSCTISPSPGVATTAISASFQAPIVKSAVYSIPIGLFVNGIGGVAGSFQLTVIAPTLSLTKQMFFGGGSAAVGPGDEIEYLLTVANAGPTPAGLYYDDVVIEDPLPATTTFVAGNANWTAFGCSYTAATHRVRCAVPALSSGTLASVSFRVKAPAAAGTITNTATASSNGGTATASTSLTTQLVAPALSLTKQMFSAAVGPGDEIEYSLTVGNAGPSWAGVSPTDDVLIEDPLPPTTTFVAGNSNWTALGCSYTAATHRVRCAVPALSPGSSASVSFRVKAPAAAGTITNTATASSNEGTATASATLITTVVNTATGSNVSVTPTDPTSGNTNVKLTFQSISMAGDTTVTSTSCPAQPPAGYTFQIGTSCYDISTTATFSGTIKVCVTDASITTSSRLFHYDGFAPDPDDVTDLPVVPPTICGTVSSLSPFAVFVDLEPPTVTITSPAAGSYILGESVRVSYRCDDLGTGVAGCTSSVDAGSLLPTGAVGRFSFIVEALDGAGNRSRATVDYVVRYGICLLSDLDRGSRGGSTIPVKLQLCDALGSNVSLPSIDVRAVGVDEGTAEDAGRSNAAGLFRFDPALGSGGGYIFDLSTRDLATGLHRLYFAAGTDPTMHELGFRLR